jgi:hypothetical protein
MTLGVDGPLAKKFRDYIGMTTKAWPRMTTTTTTMLNMFYRRNECADLGHQIHKVSGGGFGASSSISGFDGTALVAPSPFGGPSGGGSPPTASTFGGPSGAWFLIDRFSVWGTRR